MNNPVAGLGGVPKEKIDEAESAVLGSILLDGEKYFLVANIFGTFGSSVFLNKRNRETFEACARLADAGKPIDSITVDEESGAAGLDFAEMTECIVNVPSSVYAEHYAGIVLEHYRRRQVERIASDMISGVYGGELDATKIAARAESALTGNAAVVERSSDMASILAGVVDQIEQDAEARKRGEKLGVNFGIGYLDHLIGGMRIGELAILGARPGMGKTTMALQTARHVAEKTGGEVWFYSLEMTRDELGRKNLAAVSRCSYTDLRSGNVDDSEWPIILEAANFLSGLGLHIYDDPGLGDIGSIRNHAIATAARRGSPALIVVDYIQLMGSDVRRQENRTQEISQISGGLKRLAREVGCPILALSQLSRAVESRGDKRPMLSDLRESGSLEQDADSVLFLYREDYYNPETDRVNVLDIIAAKNRHGSTGTAFAYFEKTTGDIREMELKKTELDY